MRAPARAHTQATSNEMADSLDGSNLQLQQPAATTVAVDGDGEWRRWKE